VLQADLSKEDDVVQLFDKATYTFGPVQILIINHGISIVKDEYLWEMSLERWNKTMNANLTSTFLVAREYLKRLKDVSADLKEEACIILIGSTAGKYGQRFHSSNLERKLMLL
jgi:NAD(P)-dependent dehydrogenase (short-subunit alcohol dehydrogenase family)